MTPQLFINYKLKSVAHLPWRMLTYKALNTFIDDLFAFVIKMPVMYRIGCLRDGEPGWVGRLVGWREAPTAAWEAQAGLGVWAKGCALFPAWGLNLRPNLCRTPQPPDGRPVGPLPLTLPPSPHL